MNDTIYWPSFFFLMFGGIACAFAIAVVVSSNIVRMAFYLVMSLAATAGLFFVAGADFVGSMQFLIYVGGTLVLLVFGVMLTSQDRFISMKTNRFEFWMASGVGAALFVLLVIAQGPTAAPIGMALLGGRVDEPERADVASYLLVFEIISIHLLVVLIGAAYLARAKRKGAAFVE
jgi:NADH-quinone oxidoreductase subunit J